MQAGFDKDYPFINVTKTANVWSYNSRITISHTYTSFAQSSNNALSEQMNDLIIPGIHGTVWADADAQYSAGPHWNTQHHHSILDKLLFLQYWNYCKVQQFQN